MLLMITLRPYQTTAIENLRGLIRKGRRRLVLVMPCGGGKTVVGAAMIHSALERGSRALFLAHRKELIDQTVSKLNSFGVEPGVIMASDNRRDDLLPVQVASVQTLVRRLEKKPQANIIFIDECHHSTSETYKKIIDAYPGTIVIGLTATPWRSDRIGLADLYEDSVLACTPSELITIGALVPTDTFAYDAPDLHEVKITAGEYNQKDLGVACNTKVLVGSVVREYTTHAAGKRAIVFPVNVAHSQHLVGEFRAAGFRAEHVDCDTPKKERERILQGLATGAITIVASVGVLSEGFDCPAAEVCILVRPTKSLSLHIQMAGRVSRPSPETGKQRALIHDHAGNTLRHGFVDDPRDYSLNATPERVLAMHTCPACHQLFSSTKKGRCPKCDELIEVYEPRNASGDRSDHEYVEGQRISRAEIERIRARRENINGARELSDQQIARAAAATREQKAAEYLRLKDVATRKGFKDGFVGHQFRSTFSHWPKFTDEELADAAPAQRPFFPLPKRQTA